jgi:hypothetical protein
LVLPGNGFLRIKRSALGSHESRAFEVPQIVGVIVQRLLETLTTQKRKIHRCEAIPQMAILLTSGF